MDDKIPTNEEKDENEVIKNEENIKPIVSDENTETNEVNFIPPSDEKPKHEKEESGLKWLIFIVVAIVIFIIILLLLRGCNGIRNKNKSKISEANDWVTNMWNKCVDPVYWYTVDGTGVNGASINIDTVLADCDTYYNEYKEKKSEITSLSDDYSDFKEIYSKISEQFEIIYPKIKENKPVAEENVDYESNMETFYENQVKLYNLIKEKYSDNK